MILDRGSTSTRRLSILIASCTAVIPAALDTSTSCNMSALTSLPYTKTPLTTITELTMRRPRKAQTNQFDWTILFNWATDDSRGSVGPGPDPVTESLSCVEMFNG